MVYSVYGLMGRVEELDREAVLDALDLPTDYPKDELRFVDEYIHEGVHALVDKDLEAVALLVEE